MIKVESETNFERQSRAITLDLIDEIYPSTIPNHSFLMSTLIQSLKKIGQKMLKIESGNEFLTSIKGHNSGLNRRNLPIYNPKPHLPNINSYTKFEENRSKNAQDREQKRSADGRKYGRTDVPTFIFFLDILHVKKVSNNTTSTQQYPLLLRIKSYFQRL